MTRYVPRRALARGRRATATMLVALVASFLAMLDTTVVNVSLRATTARFGDLSHVQWVLTGYLLALCATMTTSAWLVGRIGPRRAFILAAGAFTIGSALCALSPTLWCLVAARVVAGAAAGILIPVATVLLTRGVPKEALGRVQALNGSVQLLGPLVGPTVGGLLVQYAGGWPAVYWVNVPVCALLVVLAVRRVPRDSSRHLTRSPLDVVGLASGTTAIVAGVWATSTAATEPVTDPRILVAVAVALVGGVTFVLRGRRSASPLLDLSLYRHPVYAWASLNVLFLGFILYAPMVVIPLYLEAARGNSAVTTGLLLSTAGVGVIASALACPSLLRRFGGGVTMVVGIGLTLLATVPFTRLSGSTSYVVVSLCLVLRGAGIGLTIVPAMTRAFESIPDAAITHASPQLNLLQRIGGAFAATVIVLVLHREALGARGLTPVVFAHASVWVLATSAVTLVPAIVLAAVEHRRGTSLTAVPTGAGDSALAA